ncbi:glycosyltransferase family 4 protein [Ruegeria sp. R14_0]|uniref:glycosyltransferase family 4 protein n=1 Tax=Ruegeria sp. R14_0 TaxID=2821100 RepID=UPI001ADA8B05|nr:glycosyltransferase family 4 protein [Ruegeria sp. R14_0]MBO9445590.1 glycosyltransferase family 4 protein [Ruegeria sp. R14_0]
MPTNVVNIPYGTKNPYQNMMYSACAPEFNLSGPRTVLFSEFAQPEFQAENEIIHIHWDDRLFGNPESEEENTIFPIAFDRLRQFQANGGRIIWTIHNKFAHAAADQSAIFCESRRQLAQLVDLVHVHTPNAKHHMISEYGTNPDKLRLIPHPSYLGVYEPAEHTLNRPLPLRDTTRLLTFGAMRGSRELDRLQQATQKLTNRGYEFHLSVVGRVFRSGRRLARRIQRNPNNTVVADRIPDEEVAHVFSQAHAYVLPSTTTFTSGTAMLAQTFGLPLIGPDIDPHKQTTPEACHDLLYPAQNPRGLIRMLMRVIAMSDAELIEKRKACFEFAIAREPARISNDLKMALSELL